MAMAAPAAPSATGSRPLGRPVAGCACAGGPVYRLPASEEGDALSFEQAHPGALPILKRLARWAAG